MNRQTLTDGSGKWFDIEKSTCYKESTRWNGNNHVSIATGSQWDHEKLYRTASGKWILHSWSQYQGVMSKWESITEDQATRWLLVNDHNVPEDIARQYEI